MLSQEAVSRAKAFLAEVPAVIGFSLPYIVGGGVLGALLGSALGSTVNGIRVGLVVGGVVAWAGLVRRRGRR